MKQILEGNLKARNSPSQSAVTGHHEGREKAGLESKDVKVSCSLCEQKHEERTNTHAKGAPDDSNNPATRSTNPCMHESLATEDQAVKRTSSWLQRDYVLGSFKANEVFPHPNIDSCADAGACEQDTIMTGKQFRGDPEGSSCQSKSNEEGFFPTAKVCSAKSSKSAMGNAKENGSNQLGICSHDAHKDCCIFQRMSEESCGQEPQRDLLASKEDDMHGTIVNTAMHPITTARVVSKPVCLEAASDLLRTYKVASVKQQCVPREWEDTASFCVKSRRDSTRFLDAEKSLLASLERLDMKLAMTSANIQNSSRTSLVSAGHQSTKSAPCVIRRKPGSDAYSVNSTMFLSRPTTSQAGGTSLFSKRRQNIGVTNVPKDRVSHLKTCNMQHMKRDPSLSCGGQKEERRPAAGTIIVHQNAEFLFN